MSVNVNADLEKLLKSVAKKENLQNYEIINVKFNEKDEGFLGEVCVVDIYDKINNQQLHLIVKSAFKEELMRSYIPIRITFENEIYFYNVVYPAFQQFQNEKNLDDPPMVPKCFMICLEDNLEGIVLQNLQHQNYEIFPKKECLDEEHIRLIFQNYGRFHAYSLAMKKQQPEIFAGLAKGFQPVGLELLETKVFIRGITETCRRVYDGFLEKFGQSDITKQLQKYLEDPLTLIKNTFKIESKNAAIVHGDCWSNNMLFRYEDSGDKRHVIDMKLIDFQLSRLGSVVCDLSYFFYSGVGKKDLAKLDDYLKLYHDSLSLNLKKFGCDADEVFPFEELKNEWKVFSPHGVIMSFLLLKVKATAKDKAYDIKDRMNENNSSGKRNQYDKELFHGRANDLVEHLYKNNYL